MKIAMFSPLPPKQTGVALYTENIVHALKDCIQLELFDTHVSYKDLLGVKVCDYANNKNHVTKLHEYDLTVYHIGNNQNFHLSIYETLLNQPGTVIIHDAVIYYLIAGQGEAGFLRDFCINYGYQEIAQFKKLKSQCTNDSLLTYPHPERYPLLKTVIQNAEAIIVHSETAKNLILSYDSKKNVYVIPFLIYRDALNCSLDKKKQKAFRKKFLIHDHEVVLGSFGFFGPTKRVEAILSALEKLKNKINFKLLLVGTGINEELKQKILKRNLENYVISTGYITSNDDFFNLMALSDMVLNLRYPSMGETSSIVIQAMYLARACIVTNHGWLSELPSDTVCKITYDETEVDSLINAIVSLSNKNYREDIGLKAKEYVIDQCHPNKVSQKYVEIFSEIMSTR